MSRIWRACQRMTDRTLSFSMRERYKPLNDETDDQILGPKTGTYGKPASGKRILASERHENGKPIAVFGRSQPVFPRQRRDLTTLVELSITSLDPKTRE